MAPFITNKKRLFRTDIKHTQDIHKHPKNTNQLPKHGLCRTPFHKEQEDADNWSLLWLQVQFVHKKPHVLTRTKNKDANNWSLLWLQVQFNLFVHKKPHILTRPMVLTYTTADWSTKKALTRPWLWWSINRIHLLSNYFLLSTHHQSQIIADYFLTARATSICVLTTIWSLG